MPTDKAAADLVPDAHVEGKKHPPVMFTTDLALREDPAYCAISKRFLDDPELFEDAWNKAWYKLCHRDMGPVSRCLGKYVAPPQPWQDPVPASEGGPLTHQHVTELKQAILASGLSTKQLVATAWASASTHRITDFRGGANGARVRLEPQKDWEANDPASLVTVISALEGVQTTFNESHPDNKVSLADLIVLGGCASVEEAASRAGFAVDVPFTPGRTDASQDQTDVESFGWLEPASDGFRNFNPSPYHLIDKAQMLGLSAPEMAVLVAGMRVLDANTAGSQVGV